MKFKFYFNYFKTIYSIFSRNMSSKSKSKRISNAKQNSDFDEMSKYFDQNVVKSETKQTPKVVPKQTKRRGTVGSDSQSQEAVKPPKNWLEIYKNIGEMRAKRDAVVDQMGAEKTFDVNEDNPKVQRFQVLVSLMLSSQTRDETTYKTMQTLKDYGLTVENINQTTEDHLRGLIGSVSFYNTKAKHIKQTSLILKDQYECDIPNTLKGLLALPGVGPKMANLAMKIAWDECTGIAVDTHVHRICNRLEWTDTKTPEQTQKQLEKWFPKSLWSEINLLLVGFGQTICRPVGPKCGECLNQELCPFSRKNKSKLEF